MTVYVDDARIPATVAGLNSRWSHLQADTRDELHAFAARLGLKRAWFQDPVVTSQRKRGIRVTPGCRAAENWHYDVTESKREQAIRLGARSVTWREMVAITNARYTAEPALAPTDPPTVMNRDGSVDPVECCASGRCEVCSPGYVWGRDG